jgi:superfamily II DNA or RNA helicase
MKINKSGYVIYKNDITEELLEMIKHDLTFEVSSKMFDFSGNQDYFRVYKENDRKLYIPRYYGLLKIQNIEYKDILLENTISIDLYFNGTLYEKQQNIVNHTLDILHSNGSIVLCEDPGGGKTVCALYIIKQLAFKTLILVNTELLMNQWKTRIEQFLPGSRIGIIRGKNKIDIEHKDIVISTIQSISRFHYPKDTFSSFGFTIYDECHHVCAKTFSECLWKCNTYYNLGLSATPIRKDNMHILFDYFFGSIHNFREFQSNGNIVNIYFKKYSNPITQKEYKIRDKLNIPKMITTITTDEQRNTMLLDIVYELIDDKMRNIIILSERREHCNYIYTTCKEKYPFEQFGLFIGGKKKSYYDEILNYRILIGTYEMIAEGFDKKEINCILLASPPIKSDIEQISGRALRQKHTIDVHIIDIYDTYSIFNGLYRKRKHIYEKNNFKIEGQSQKNENEKNTQTNLFL